MKIIDQDNQVQKEALINECKGNLFEFLVAQALSKKFGNEANFLLDLPPIMKERLKTYEVLIRQYDPDLLARLSPLAHEVAISILARDYFSVDQSWTFKVIGKMVATNVTELWNETDIVAINSSGKKIYLSLKLTKDNSFTNTKSAGVKSFLEKYFSPYFIEASTAQRQLSDEVDESFHMMGHKLYELIDRDFSGHFDQAWSENYSELPGELPEAMREIVFYNYSRVAKLLHQLMSELLKKDRHLFKQALSGLCGFGSDDIIQIHCFHQNDLLKKVVIKSYEDMFSDDESFEIGDYKAGASSFDILFKRFTLQIRIKPMNKFTTAAYKVNCSIKMK